MTKDNKIKTVKTVYPQIYAYTLPENQGTPGYFDIGNIKIGYTDRYDVNDRIIEQTKTAAGQLHYDLLWSSPAIFHDSNTWFDDKKLHTYLRVFKHRKQQKFENGRYSEWFYYNGTPEDSIDDLDDFRSNIHIQAKEKSQYVLRKEQRNAIDKTLNYINENRGGEFLWNAKPRFGKTLTTYDLARQTNANKVLIVSNRPSTANSWFDDFEKYISWQTNFAFVSTNDTLKDRAVLDRSQFIDQMHDGKDRMIAFISLQDLKGAISFGGDYDKLAWVKELEWDLLVIDESHEGIDTLKTDIAFDNIKRNFTLYLSGTPFKAIASGKFSEEQIFNWSYVDEQSAKMEWPKNIEENNPYEKLPQLNLYSYQMSQMITDEVNRGSSINGKSIDYTFDLNEFFDTKDNGDFVYEDEVIKWLDTLTTNEKYPFSTKDLRNELKHTLWLLYRVSSAKALEKILKNHPVFENYEIVLAAGDGKTEDDQVVNEKSINRVKKAILNSDKTITLSVGQLTTGTTIPEWTGVLMLSNIKSPSLYMQAAFRSQNSWSYERDGRQFQKERSYVFDFAPERTLIIYDEFANSLMYETSGGRGTERNREDNVRKLLNFFPVIAEDTRGKMIKLDVNQVLTIPKTIKSKEVVRCGFMSNFLLQNISRVFSSSEVCEILNQLNPLASKKSGKQKTSSHVDRDSVNVDANGNIIIDNEIVVAETEGKFGSKVYQEIVSTINEDDIIFSKSLASEIENIFFDSMESGIEEVAKEYGIKKKNADQILKQNGKVIARKIESVQKQAKINYNEIKVEYSAAVSEACDNPEKILQLKILFERKMKDIELDFRKKIDENSRLLTHELMEKSVEDIVFKSENRKKNEVEDDVRSRLRGFARTIPSFLMAYGEPGTNLDNFDKMISESVFKETTGITLNQFRMLRDVYNFFDPIIFDESIKEFLNKKRNLANYFDETQDEDIFDYIPSQQTNQVFTPKKIVRMMVNNLEEEDPDVFSNPDKTFVDLYMKSGLYITEIVKKLYVGLNDVIPDPSERLKHILENQVYGFAPTEIIYNISKNYIFGFDEKAKSIDDSNIVYLDTTIYAKGENDFEKKCDELFG